MEATRKHGVRTVTVTPTVLVMEEGTEASYSVVLGTQPRTGDVTVQMTTDLSGTDLSGKA